jgi:hypothetical protein
MNLELTYKQALMLSEFLFEASRAVPRGDKERYHKMCDQLDQIVEDYICRRRHAAQDWYQDL